VNLDVLDRNNALSLLAARIAHDTVISLSYGTPRRKRSGG
jgi:hypothetical protein